MSIYDIKVTTIDGQEKSLTDFRDQVLLVVNVASRCGFTPQYDGLEALYEKFKARGFSVLGFPCNQFGHQEPGDEAEIKTFCSTKFNVTFPMFAKIDVIGDKTHPLYQFLKTEKPGIWGTEGIKWNFTKFLIDRRGEVVARFAPITPPDKIEGDIEKLLAV
jgi:glutathione peroxidase